MKNKGKTFLKCYLTAGLCLSGCLTAFAQQDMKFDTVRVEDQNPSRVITNGFWDNWYIGAGAGLRKSLDDHNGEMKFTQGLAPNFSFYLGKAFNPSFGARIGIDGFEVKGLTQGPHSTGVRYSDKPWQGYWLYNQKFNYFNIHADVLFNLSNIFEGYRADRFYEISPYLGVGWLVTNDKPTAQELGASLGIFNTFRLGKAVNLTLDVRSDLVNDRFDGEVGGRKNEGALAALVGLQFKLKKRDWDRPVKVTVIEHGNDQELAALRKESEKQRREIEKLRKQLAEASEKTVTQVKVERGILAAPLLVTFAINESKVSNEARVNLGYLAGTIKGGDPNKVYTVTGYADKNTGSSDVNEKLSSARSKAIYDVLVEEFGVPKHQLKMDHKGGVENMFYNDPRLSRVVITGEDEK